jgi:hypothetical protein
VDMKKGGRAKSDKRVTESKARHGSNRLLQPKKLVVFHSHLCSIYSILNFQNAFVRAETNGADDTGHAQAQTDSRNSVSHR